MRERRHVYAVLLYAVLLAGCYKPLPPKLTPVGAQAYRAAQAATVINTVLRTAINMHDAQMLSKANTTTVVTISEVALKSLQATPLGWQAITGTALDEIAAKLDADGKTQLASWLKVANVMLQEIR